MTFSQHDTIICTRGIVISVEERCHILNYQYPFGGSSFCIDPGKEKKNKSCSEEWSIGLTMFVLIFFLTSLYQYNQTSNAINFFPVIYMHKVILYKNVHLNLHMLSNEAISSMLQLVVVNAIFNNISFI